MGQFFNWDMETTHKQLHSGTGSCEPESRTCRSSAERLLKRPMASLMTSVSWRSGMSALMLFLFSSSHSWKPVLGLQRANPHKLQC